MARTPKPDRFLEPAAAEAVNARVAELEAARGVEVVTAVIARADSYPEVPWKAFALGASLAALGATVMALFQPGWGAFEAVAQTAIAILAAGSTFALGTIWIPQFARIFIPVERRDVEVRQYAQALFLENALHCTRRHDGILVVVSLLEREVAVIADRGVSEKVPRSELDAVVAAMTDVMSRARIGDALLAGLGRLDEILGRYGLHAQRGDTNELPDSVIQRRGPV